MNTRSVVAASALLLTVSGCREDAVSPSGPESEPALATATTTPLAFTQVSGQQRGCRDSKGTLDVITAKLTGARWLA